MTEADLYVGCMTGTSVDALDLALINVAADGEVDIVAAESAPISFELRQQLLALGQAENDNIDRLGACDRALGHATADAIQAFLAKSGYDATDIRAIGSHGQTVRHRPPGTTEDPFTLQIGDPNIIAEQTNITTVADFRRRDMAAGGHGAPLVPRFHAALFSSKVPDACVINIGGISNVSLLGAQLRGFDTGPGNGLLDQWCDKHLSEAYDKEGVWAAGGKVNEILLDILLADQFFSRPPPKSTGREYFNLAWLEQCAEGKNLSLAAAPDIQATLSQLTATSIARALQNWGGNLSALIICGGGRHNTDLMSRLRHAALMLSDAPHTIEPSEHWGVDGDAIEAAAFAWFAHRRLHHLPGNVAGVTGARGERVLGAIF